MSGWKLQYKIALCLLTTQSGHSSFGIDNMQVFDDAKKQLTTTGYKLVASEYNNEAFGSWYIVIDTMPNRRIVWEGRDSILRVDEETAEILNGKSVWENIYESQKIDLKDIPSVVTAIIGLP